MRARLRNSAGYPAVVVSIALGVGAFAVCQLVREGCAGPPEQIRRNAEPLPLREGERPEDRGPLWGDDEPLTWPDGSPAGTGKDHRRD